MSKKILFEAPDISVHQGVVNMKQIRDAGYPQVYLRAGYGKNNVDQRFAANALACLNLLLQVMIYWFSYALNAEMAAKEAEYAIAQAKKYWSKCPIAFDLEYDTIRYAATRGVHIDKQLATDMAIAFLKVVKQEGYTPVIYFNRDYRRNYFDLERIQKEVGDVKYWYARYSNAISGDELSDTDLWQYTSKGSIAGVNGNVDLNKVYTNLFEGVNILAPQEKVTNLYIQRFQKAANADGYTDDNGRKLAEDGIDGPCTQAVRRKVFLKARALLFVGSTGELVKWWQKRLNEIMDIDLEVDGRFGKATRNATRDFQDKYGLKVDGIAGYNSIQTAFYN